ncbi:hypothetical protein BDR26DRAFT_870516 [Obelidium mucronatum]|nr:hypothetical protein BDR26DRAFT_870516 [Obelidium mucronatum]
MLFRHVASNTPTRLFLGLRALPITSSNSRIIHISRVIPRRQLFGFGKPNNSKATGEKKGFKQLLAQHGPAALITYAVLSGISFAGFYVAIVWSGVDPLALMHKLPFADKEEKTRDDKEEQGKKIEQHESKDLLDQVGDAIHVVGDAVAKGFENAEDVVGVGMEGLDAILHHEEHHHHHHHNVQQETQPTVSYFNGTTALVAWCVHELFLPIRLGLTAYLTPRVSARMKGGAIDLWLGRIMARFGAKKGSEQAKEAGDAALKAKLLDIRHPNHRK